MSAKKTKLWKGSEIEQFKEFLEEFCLPPYGTLVGQFLYTVSVDNLYEKYCERRQKKNEEKMENIR
jgi:hypothetical protein